MMTSLSGFSVMLPSLYYSKTFSPPQHQFKHSKTSLRETISGPPPTRPAWLNVSRNPATRFQGLVTADSHFHFGQIQFAANLFRPSGREDPNSGRLCRRLRGRRVPPVSHQTLHLILGSEPSRDLSFQTNHTTICLSALRPTAMVLVDTWLGTFPLIVSGCVPNQLYRKRK